MKIGTLQQTVFNKSFFANYFHSLAYFFFVDAFLWQGNLSSYQPDVHVRLITKFL